MIRGFFGFLIILSFAAQAQAALISDLRGTVRVGSGPGAFAVSSPTTVVVGSVVQTGPDSSATVYFDNGCSEVIQANQSRTIPENPTCELGALLTNDYTALVVGGVVFGAAALAITLANRDRSSSPASP